MPCDICGSHSLYVYSILDKRVCRECVKELAVDAGLIAEEDGPLTDAGLRAACVREAWDRRQLRARAGANG